MNMQYEQQILLILKEAYPYSMPVRRIALNVYNFTNTLFEPQDRKKVHSAVAEWLRAESRKSGGSVIKGDLRGWYKLNEHSLKVQQLLLDFRHNEEDDWMLWECEV